MNPNRRFAELAGVNCEPRLIKEWPVYYGNELVYTSVDPQDGTKPEIRYVYPPIIDYAADAREVLRVMMEREDYESFRRHLIYTFFDDFYAPVIDITGKLRDVAIEWMEGEHGR